MGLAPYQQRVIDEKSQMDEKIVAIAKFQETRMFLYQNPAESGRIREQHAIMDKYSAILAERIAHFT